MTQKNKQDLSGEEQMIEGKISDIYAEGGGKSRNLIGARSSIDTEQFPDDKENLDFEQTKVNVGPNIFDQ